MNIDTYLRELADTSAPLKLGRLANLSDLDEEESRRCATLWPTLPVDRRRAVLEQLTDLSEDNPELNFDAVYIAALADSDAGARRLAIEGLWEHEDRDVIPLFIRLLQEDGDATVRSAAAQALGQFVLRGEFDAIRPSDLEKVTDALRGVVRDVRESPDVRGRALEAIGASSQPWARDLIHDNYDSDDAVLMVSAVHAMGRSADEYWLPTLLNELHSADPQMRYEAATALGAIEDEEAVPYLVELFEDEDSEVQEAAIQALGVIGGPDARRALSDLIRAGDERLREVAVAALEQADFGDDPLGLRMA